MGSAPPEILSRPKSREGPESQPDPAFTHFGAFSVESYTAVCDPTDEFTVKAMVVL